MACLRQCCEITLAAPLAVYARDVNRLWLIALAAAATAVVSVGVAGQQRAARAGALPECSGDEIPLPTTVAQRVGGEVVGVTALGTWGTSPCVLHDRLTFAAQPASDRFSPHGVIRSIKGNPAVKAMNITLRPGNVRVYAWRWRNWCGAHGRFIVQASWKALPYTIPSESVTPPRCVERGSRSTLSETRPAIRPCATTAYRVSTDLGQPFESRLIDFINITPRKGGPPCLLRNLSLNLSVQGESGAGWKTLDQIKGNPGHRKVGTMLTQTYGALGVFWAWFNWCDGGHQFRTYARVGTRAVAGSTSAQGATCEDQAAPSTLVPSYGH